MKKFLFVFIVSLSAMAIEPVAHTETGAPTESAITRSTVVKVDKAAKLEQYINACLVQRPGVGDDIKKLLQ